MLREMIARAKWQYSERTPRLSQLSRSLAQRAVAAADCDDWRSRTPLDRLADCLAFAKLKVDAAAHSGKGLAQLRLQIITHSAGGPAAAIDDDWQRGGFG